MTFQRFCIEGLLLITPDIFRDERGCFLETYNINRYNELPGFNYSFTQDNMSYSRYGTLRGLHFQKEPYAQTKLVRCVVGKIWDIAVDIRPGSATYAMHVGVELTSELQQQFLIPRGFAHGFSVLSEEAIVEYKCDTCFVPEADAGIIYNDPELSIDWHLVESDIVISVKDANLPLLQQITGRKL
jgi:dTDP-4-dehydrorhamnose 3,5-epimerase